MVVYACYPSYMATWEAIDKRIVVKAGSGQKHESLSEKELKQKCAGVMGEWLPSKKKAQI
jgi:hypothetical protein